jgi:hypothetical protein
VVNNGKTLTNEAMFVQESLHGMTGLFDKHLMEYTEWYVVGDGTVTLKWEH